MYRKNVVKVISTHNSILQRTFGQNWLGSFVNKWSNWFVSFRISPSALGALQSFQVKWSDHYQPIGASIRIAKERWHPLHHFMIHGPKPKQFRWMRKYKSSWLVFKVDASQVSRHQDYRWKPFLPRFSCNLESLPKLSCGRGSKSQSMLDRRSFTPRYWNLWEVVVADVKLLQTKLPLASCQGILDRI